MQLNQCCSTSFSHYKSTFECTSTTYIYVIVGPRCIISSEVDGGFFKTSLKCLRKRSPRRISEPSTIPSDFAPSNSQALPLPRLASLIVSWDVMLMVEWDPCVLYSTLATKTLCFHSWKQTPQTHTQSFQCFFLFVSNFREIVPKMRLEESAFLTLWP